MRTSAPIETVNREVLQGWARQAPQSQVLEVIEALLAVMREKALKKELASK